MFKMNKKFLTPFLATGLIVLGGFAFAGDTLASEESFKPMFNRFAERLGITTQEAQEAWDMSREEVLQEKLNSLELTEEQKADILTKREEFKTRLDELRNEEPRDCEEMHSLMGEINQWAEENNVPPGFVKGKMQGRMSGNGMGNGFRHMNEVNEFMK